MDDKSGRTLSHEECSNLLSLGESQFVLFGANFVSSVSVSAINAPQPSVPELATSKANVHQNCGRELGLHKSSIEHAKL